MRYFAYLLICISFSAQLCAKKYVVLIGISNYNPRNEQKSYLWNNIHGANDVELLENYFGKKDRVGNLITIRNQEATASNIRKALGNLAKNVQSGDVVYIHFSGHGQPVEDYSGDEADGWDEAIVAYGAQKVYKKGRYEGENHITDDEISQYISKISNKIGKKGMAYIVIDACHSGDSQRSDEEDNIRGTNTGFSRNQKVYAPKKTSHGLSNSKKGSTNVCFLEACRSYQTNREISEGKKYYGPLSYYIYKVLSSIRSLSSDKKWVYEVQKMMSADKRLTNQNMVIQ